MRSIFPTIRYKLTTRHKNSKLAYYVRNYISLLMPDVFVRSSMNSLLRRLPEFDVGYVFSRVHYYNKLRKVEYFSAPPLSELKIQKKQKVYFFDSFRYTRHFEKSLLASFLFGDITSVPAVPSIVKSRPIQHDNENSVLLKLNKVRHFLFVNDKNSFSSKKDMLVGRGAINRPHRTRFYELYFHHPLCNLGQTNRKKRPEWVRDWMTIEDQLKYKFILCLEGNDVASNLKWVMSSNSLAVMPRPKFETWFMEGTLIPDHHYVCIKDDYSDLEEKLRYFIEHPEKANLILRHANDFVKQFMDSQREDLISLLVLNKYFEQTGQLKNRLTIHPRIEEYSEALVV